jgi:hypothetical protein
MASLFDRSGQNFQIRPPKPKVQMQQQQNQSSQPSSRPVSKGLNTQNLRPISESGNLGDRRNGK